MIQEAIYQRPLPLPACRQPLMYYPQLRGLRTPLLLMRSTPRLDLAGRGAGRDDV